MISMILLLVAAAIALAVSARMTLTLSRQPGLPRKNLGAKILTGILILGMIADIMTFSYLLWGV